MLGPRGGGVGGTPSRAGLPRTLSQEALREVAASLTLMTNVTDNPSRYLLIVGANGRYYQPVLCRCLTLIGSLRPILFRLHTYAEQLSRVTCASV